MDASKKEPGNVAPARPFSPAQALASPTPPHQAGPWPRSAQWAGAVLLAGVVVLLGCHALSGMRVFTRWSELRDSTGPIYRMDLNRARLAELVQLPGVGAGLAKRIVDLRREQGPFRTVDDLRRVSGIGPKTLERIRPWVCVEASYTAVTLGPSANPPRQARSRSRPGVNKKAKALAGAVIDVNHAPVSDLQRLPGIGPKMSQRIIDERARAPFQTVDDLRRVKGIGKKTLEKLRPFVTVAEPSKGVAAAKNLP